MIYYMLVINEMCSIFIVYSYVVLCCSGTQGDSKVNSKYILIEHHKNKKNYVIGYFLLSEYFELFWNVSKSSRSETFPFDALTMLLLYTNLNHVSSCDLYLLTRKK